MHTTRAILFLTGVCLLAQAAPAAAIPPAKLALIEEVLRLAPSADLEALRATRLLGKHDNPDDLVSFDPSADITTADSRIVAAVRRSRVQLYDRLFTADELRQLVAFYKSDIGKKSMRASAELPELVVKNVLATEAARPAAEVQPAKRHRTRAILRTIAVTLEARATDVNTYPSGGTIAQIAAIVEPTYIRKTPLKDDWGNPIAYFGTKDGLTYRLVSGGTDGVIEKAHKTARQPVLKRTDDIVFENGLLLTPEN